jgi:hypothetical protein
VSQKIDDQAVISDQDFARILNTQISFAGRHLHKRLFLFLE